MPSGAVLLACLALPGYRDCGHVRAMTYEPVVAAACCIGAVFLIAGCVVRWLARDERREHVVAIVCAALAKLSMALFILLCTSQRVYVGLALALASSASLFVGGLIWEREAFGRDEVAAKLFRVALPVVILALVATATFAEWHPRPDDPVPSGGWWIGGC